MRIYALGQITPGSTTPAPINTNFPAVTKVSKVVIRALPSNSAADRLFVGFSNMNTTTGFGVLEMLSPDERFVLNEEQSSTFDISKICVLGANGSDAVLITGWER